MWCCWLAMVICGDVPGIPVQLYHVCIVRCVDVVLVENMLPVPGCCC